MTLLELNYQRRKAKSEATGLLDRAVTESRSLTLAEQVHFDALTARLHEFDTAIAERKSLRKLAE
ncbi:MAG: hypothetical protein WBQ76_13920 [Candidatus Korobacteraceae bacterium]